MTGEDLLEFIECSLAKIQFDSDSDRKKMNKLTVSHPLLQIMKFTYFVSIL